MNKLYDDTAVQAIANAIRAKNGSSDTYTIAEMSTALNDISYYAKPTISNVSLATFEADGLPLNSLKVSVEAKQAGSGTPSPENVRPITGWDAVVVSDTGINIWDAEWELGRYNLQNGEPIESSNSIRNKNKIPIKPNTIYFFKVGNYTALNDIVRASFYDKDKSYIGSDTRSQLTGGAFRTPDNAYYMTFYCTSAYGNTYNNDISINYPSTDTSYHAYNGVTTTISLPQTVYGGEVDVVNGVLTITDGYIASYNGETLPSTWISSMDEYAEGTSPTTGAEVCYELATPTTIPLTPTLIKSLNGLNNLSVDSGDVIELEYFKEV